MELIVKGLVVPIFLAAALMGVPIQARAQGSRVRGDFGGPPYVGIEHISVTRWRAVHVCSIIARPHPIDQRGYGGHYKYMACMAEFHQPP